MILARNAPCAVIFRRGPSGWFQLILWHTDSDGIEYGQWVHGCVYVRRSDLSPDGTKLIYFVRKISGRTIADRGYTYAWTAISKPPYYTALALWPKGDCWYGGGLFEDDHTVFLNHKPERANPHPKHLPQGLTVRPNPGAYGEDDPIYSARLTRDGWQLRQEWDVEWVPGIMYRTNTPEIRVRTHTHLTHHVELTRRLDGLKYRELFKVLDQNGQPLIDPAGVEWADWDQQGRLVVLRKGKLLVGSEVQANGYVLHELSDFNDQKPQPLVAPKWATSW
jgi:hypothetical protein